ncbi:TRAFs-binding domain-containing protein [Pseudokineococcus basanitobsidens]|uniref:TRAFs-binding domain-containing protein n=1 Tax=Pseudokineococcus basanitobsidens TaxID=1926649 RepID=A0ABU8RF38_9ACTN
MPFGVKPHPESGQSVDFDHVFEKSIRPAIEAAGLEPLRDDMTTVGGMVQKSLFDALLMCDFVVVDLTAVNGNVFYELGIRHAVRPASTVAITARPDAMPFDVRNLRAVRYQLDDHDRLDDRAAQDLREALTEALLQAKSKANLDAKYMDSPLYQLVESWRPPPPASMKTDDFAAQVERDQQHRYALAGVRRVAIDKDVIAARRLMQKCEAGLPEPSRREPALAMDVLLTHRALEDWDSMIRVVEAMPPTLRNRSTPLEQLAFALNRRAEVTGSDVDLSRALEVLRALVSEARGTSETFGLIGRVHKGEWRRATSGRRRASALASAIDAYAEGHWRDMTDPYPGINACTLATIRGDRDDVALVERILPVVSYATEVQLHRFEPTSWMFATMLEVSVLRDDRVWALKWLEEALVASGDRWGPVTTLQTLNDLLAAYRVRDGERGEWLNAFIEQFREAFD